MPGALKAVAGSWKAHKQGSLRSCGQPTQRHASSNLLPQLRTQKLQNTNAGGKKKRESSSYSQTTRTAMFKSKDVGRAAERKSCPKQSTAEILCCFSQQPLRQDKEEICCMATSVVTALRLDLLFLNVF